MAIPNLPYLPVFFYLFTRHLFGTDQIMILCFINFHGLLKSSAAVFLNTNYCTNKKIDNNAFITYAPKLCS